MSDRRRIGRLLAERQSAARRLGGPPAVLEALADLDEGHLGRRRLASEERSYQRLLQELERATAEGATDQ